MNLKKDFPIFKSHPHLVYLDSAATSLKPKVVINKIVEYYEKYSANVFRGIYKISEKATEEYESSRKIVAEFVGAETDDEIVFTRNTTESLNLIAYSLGEKIISKGDEVVTTIMEHHSNFVPWQQLTHKNKGKLKIIDIDEEGRLQLDFLERVITAKTKILTLTYVSNVLGTINPIRKIVQMAKKINPHVIIIIDAAQAAPHTEINVKNLGCDFLAFSSHKMLGPTGVGVLWGKKGLLESICPFNFGGEMVREVYLTKTIFKETPHKFEAGTPNIADVIALKEAINYLVNLGRDKIRKHEEILVKYTIKRLKEEFKNKLKILGPKLSKDRGSVIAFKFKQYHPHDIAQILDEENICVRAGHHCAMPLHQRLGIPASARVSFYIYNDQADVERLIKGFKKVEKMLS